MKTRKILLQAVVSGYRVDFKGLYIIAPEKAAAKAVELFSKPRIRKFRPKEMEVLSKAEQGEVKYEGLKIKTYRWGIGKKTVLLVHGWEGHAGHLGAFVEPLVSEGFQVLAFDAPAHGGSEGQNTNLLHYGNLISRLSEENNVEAIITHSFGSAATAFALYKKQHSIKNLVMITSPDKLEDVLDEFGNLMKFNISMRQHILQYIEKLYGRNPKEIQVSLHAPQMDVENILLVHSPDDRILPFSNTKKIYQNLPNATLEAPKNKGHYKILWDKEVVEKVVNFIGAN
jgi:pimeloyl-ACP methyl ester carboxylesterase